MKNQAIVNKALRKTLRILLIAIAGCLVFVAVFLIIANAIVTNSTKDHIVSVEEAGNLANIDCVLVLGCGVRPDGTPTPMLEDRVSRGIELYKTGIAPKLLMTGDHGTDGYDEVNTMKKLAIEAEVPSSDVFMDHAGFSTYESMYRAKDVFGVKRVLVVTQDYHLPRALYAAQQLGLDAYGVAANIRKYGGQEFRDAREILARGKEFINCIIKPEPTYLGSQISLKDNGDITNG